MKNRKENTDTQLTAHTQTPKDDPLLHVLLCVRVDGSASSEKYGENIPSSKFKCSTSTGQKVVYTLRIMEIQEDDAGFYSCLFKTKKVSAGYYILPGVNPPTVQPPTVKTDQKPVKPCFCKPNRHSPKGCEHSVLWPGIGALLLLAITLAGTLYYFSRLPKKCRHRFTKTNPLR
ncbi:uncharacterized protein cd8b isoform X2 [Siphateles boraxobius]|uniref:uncharacterized protein cd8b isoform X2 n=1 Tax=Siphateles boraxobius TaxID=180520 RepID=UPI0040629901